MKYKLVIWDFDGVIADSEKVWIKNRQQCLNKKFNLNWDFETTNKYLGGMSDKTKKHILEKMGYKTDDNFWNEQVEVDIQSMKLNGLEITPYVEEIIKKLSKQCIATGGTFNKTKVKLETINFWNQYFSENNIFTADMVKHGKPEPDLFLYASQKMNEKPENCIVIEDSIAGLTAALKANMDVIAFLGCEMYHNDSYLQKVKELGIKNICYTMQDVEKIILDF